MGSSSQHVNLVADDTRLDGFELLREGIGLLPPRGKESHGSAIWVRLPGNTKPLRSCNCAQCRQRQRGAGTCDALRALGDGLRVYEQTFPRGWQHYFERTIWFRLAKAIFAGSQLSCEQTRVQQVERTDNGRPAIRFLDPQGEEVAQMLDVSTRGMTFLERLGKISEGDADPQDADGRPAVVRRAAVLERLRLFQLSDQERAFEKAGMRSGRQAWDDSFWNRLAYHCVREYGRPAGSAEASMGRFHPAIDQKSGDFTLLHRLPDGASTFKITLPRSRVEAVLKLLAKQFPEQEDLQIHPVPLRSIFHVSRETELDLRVRPVIRWLQESGEETFIQREKRFTYGRLIYISRLGILAQLESDRQKRKFATPKSMNLAQSQVPSFLEDHVEALEDGSLVLEEPLQGLQVHKTYDRVEVDANPVEGSRGRYRLKVEYHFGNLTVALTDLLRAKYQDLPYLETDAGWIDLKAPAFQDLDRWAQRGAQSENIEAGLEMSAGEVLRFQASARQPLEPVGPKDRQQWLRRLLDREPPKPYKTPDGFHSRLRDYQRLGVDWLRFLAEQRLGGLLCDDMGLGKTHQSMALMACLEAEADTDGPFLVISPTSVISHWRDKIQTFASRLKPRVYHGPDRRLDRDLTSRHVVLTSYGVLRNDIDKLKTRRWSAAIFDEIQYLKNRQTRAYTAAEQLPVEVKIGLTGTPIENSLGELKSLLDLVVPGYLGTDQAFRRQFDVTPGRPAPGRPAPGRQGAEQQFDLLRRLIQPFVLRRLKTSVLDELPPKIEDLRSCELSPEQVAMYRQALAGRGRELVAQIKDGDGRLPYLHVFALLDMLKQICNHPAAVIGDLDPDAHASGKWDLFCEILRESLDAGEKVVVFSQYLKMLEMISRHLDGESVDHVRLEGSTAAKRRGELIRRFNEDPSCRVFLGSLRAGGTGIDLVGGSVVIHYDRWWNAAREDQATDRVHRMGQKKVVQVFKLVTEGTLEEKIARMIESKRDLLDEVVQEDDPRLAKTFSRDELLDLLQDI